MDIYCILIAPRLLVLGILILRYVITSRGRPSGIKLPYVHGWLCGDSKATGATMFRGPIALCRTVGHEFASAGWGLGVLGVWLLPSSSCWHESSDAQRDTSCGYFVIDIGMTFVMLKGRLVRTWDFCGSYITLDNMPVTPYPFGVLMQFPSAMPRDIARALGVREEWELCDERRRQNRELYIELVASDAKNDRIRLAVRTAALICRLGSGLVLLPSEAVMRILEFVVVTRCRLSLPPTLVTWVTAAAGNSWYCGLVDGVRGQSVATFAPASFLIQIELNTMETCASYLRDWIIRGERRHARIQQEVIRFASRHIPADVYLPVHEFPLVIVTNE